MSKCLTLTLALQNLYSKAVKGGKNELNRLPPPFKRWKKIENN